jgi:hypothetical protein
MPDMPTIHGTDVRVAHIVRVRFVMTKSAIAVGDQVFAEENGEAFGVVRRVRAHELVIDIEGGGDVVIPAIAVRAAHDEKVILDTSQLPPATRQAIERAHSLEDR